MENENGLFYFNHMGDALQNRELAMLRSFPNVIFTPHTAFYTDVNVASMVESAFKAVRAMADGEQTPLEMVQASASKKGQLPVRALGQDDFYPQFNANTQALWPLLDKML